MTTTEAAYRREKERADRAEEVNREWQDKWLDEGVLLSKKGITRCEQARTNEIVNQLAPMIGENNESISTQF